MNRCITSATNGIDQVFLVDRPEEYQASTDLIKSLLEASLHYCGILYGSNWAASVTRCHICQVSNHGAKIYYI
jgi:hypothetical protein